MVYSADTMQFYFTSLDLDNFQHALYKVITYHDLDN